MWQIKQKQLQKNILKYLSVSVYSFTRWITWVIKSVEEKNLMEMIIWLLSLILTNQAYQLCTSKLSESLWDFLFYYLKLIKQLIVGPHVPFHTVDTWSEKQQLDIYFMTMQQSSLTGLKAACPSLHHLVSNIEKTQKTHLFTDVLTEELINWSPCQPVFYLFIWPLFESLSGACWADTAKELASFCTFNDNIKARGWNTVITLQN